QVQAHRPVQLPRALPAARGRRVQPRLPLPADPARTARPVVPVPDQPELERGRPLLPLAARQQDPGGHGRRAVGQLLCRGSAGRAPLRAQSRGRTQQRADVRNRTEGPGFGRPGHPPRLAPGHPRLQSRRPVPGAAADRHGPARRLRCRRHSMTRLPRYFLAAALACLPAAGALAQTYAAAQPVDRIAAVVNEDVILRSELERAIANIRAQYAGKETQLPPDDVLQRQVLERLILSRLEIARATDAGIGVSDQELEQAVQGVAQQNGLGVDQLRETLAADGMSFTDFRNDLRNEILTQKLRQSFAQGRINVSEAEVDAAMASAAGSASLQFHLSHILVGIPDGATPEQIGIAEK